MNHVILRKFKEKFSKNNQKLKGDIAVMYREEEFMLGTEQPNAPYESQPVPCDPDPIDNSVNPPEAKNPFEFEEPSESTETATHQKPIESEGQSEPDDMSVSADNNSAKFDEFAATLALLSGKLDTISEQVAEKTRESKETVTYLDEFFRKFINARDTAAELKLAKVNDSIMSRIDEVDQNIAHYSELYNKIVQQISEFKQSMAYYDEIITPLIKALYSLIKNQMNLSKRLKYILSTQDIFAIDLGGSLVADGLQQEIVSVIPTNDPALDNTISKIERIGYKQGDNILRSERVSVYKYKR